MGQTKPIPYPDTERKEHTMQLFNVKVELIDAMSHWDVPVIAETAEQAKDIVRPTLPGDALIYGVEEAQAA